MNVAASPIVSRFRRFSPTLALILWAWLGAAMCQAQAPLSLFRLYKLPKGMEWGQTRGEVEVILKRERAKILSREGDSMAEIWEVKDLFMSNLDSAGFTFIDNKLEAVELRYGNARWSERKVRGVFEDFRILNEHHMGRPSDSRTDGGTDGGVKESTEILSWNLGDRVVRLVYFTAEKEGQTDPFRLVSVHLTRKEGEATMREIASAGFDEGSGIAKLKDAPGAGGEGESLFVVEPDLPGGAVANSGVTLPEEPLPEGLFSEEQLQAGTPADPAADPLAVAAEIAAAGAVTTPEAEAEPEKKADTPQPEPAPAGEMPAEEAPSAPAEPAAAPTEEAAKPAPVPADPPAAEVPNPEASQ